MMIELKPGRAPRRALDHARKPNNRPENASVKANEIERAAYIAAHRILVADTSGSELACRGGRRSRAVDTIAEIIKEVFELCTLECAYRDRAAVSSPDSVEQYSLN